MASVDKNSWKAKMAIGSVAKATLSQSKPGKNAVLLLKNAMALCGVPIKIF